MPKGTRHVSRRPLRSPSHTPPPANGPRSARDPGRYRRDPLQHGPGHRKSGKESDARPGRGFANGQPSLSGPTARPRGGDQSPSAAQPRPAGSRWESRIPLRGFSKTNGLDWRRPESAGLRRSAVSRPRGPRAADADAIRPCTDQRPGCLPRHARSGRRNPGAPDRRAEFLDASRTPRGRGDGECNCPARCSRSSRGGLASHTGFADDCDFPNCGVSELDCAACCPRTSPGGSFPPIGTASEFPSTRCGSGDSACAACCSCAGLGNICFQPGSAGDSRLHNLRGESACALCSESPFSDG